MSLFFKKNLEDNTAVDPIDTKDCRSLKNLTTMQIGGYAKYFKEVLTDEEIINACNEARELNIEIFPLGEGSNTIFSDKIHNLLILKIMTKGILKVYENEEIINLEVSAGENWDDFVAWTVKHNLGGLENMSGIPGTVGASPIQNIGAYGSEVKDNLIKVKILDLETFQIFEITNPDCNFSYRDSVFKQNLGHFIILSVFFSLNKFSKKVPIPEYKDVQLYFLNKNKKTASLKEIRNAILEIRNNKIPNYKQIPNSGSFFKNPIVDNRIVTQIILDYPEMPYFKASPGTTKLFAGWLIEKCDLKGYSFGNLKIDTNNCLIITNPNKKASFEELLRFISIIRKRVREKFSIDLEVEPNVVV